MLPRLLSRGVHRVQHVAVALLALAGAARRVGGAVDAELGGAVGRAEPIVGREFYPNKVDAIDVE